LKLCPECFTEYQDELDTCPEDSSPLSLIEEDPLVGQKINDRYEVLSVLGRGGMGVVYKARHEHMERVVAIKMLHAYMVSDAEALKRFHREAKAVSRVKHPHTIALYDFGLTPNGQPFIVMDYIEGISLKKIIKQEGAITLERADHIFPQVVEALSCAHQEGVIHRDLKPENIMLTRRGNDPEWVEVVDFGISKLKSKEDIQQSYYDITRIGDVCGSPPYMSPEQCLASVPVDARSDIYALGVVLYEAISGKLPFRAKTAIEMIDCHLYAPPTPLKAANPDLACCEALNSMLMKALHKEPDKRQQTMDEFGAELREAIKRDLIKLKSLRQRSELLAAGAEADLEAGAVEVLTASRSAASRSSGSHARLVPESAPAEVTVDSEGLGAPIEFEPSTGGWLSRFGRGFLGFLGGRDSGAGYDRGYLLAECPYCSAPVKPKIRFCLDCGHNLPSPQELAKLRQAQGVYTLPRSHRPAAGSENPEFSIKTKVATAKARGSWGVRSWVIVLNLVLVLLLCLVYINRNQQQFQSALEKVGLADKGDQHKVQKHAAPVPQHPKHHSRSGK